MALSPFISPPLAVSLAPLADLLFFVDTTQTVMAKLEFIRSCARQSSPRLRWFECASKRWTTPRRANTA